MISFQKVFEKKTYHPEEIIKDYDSKKETNNSQSLRIIVRPLTLSNSNILFVIDILITPNFLQSSAGACLNFFQWGCTNFLFNNRVFCVVDFIIHFGNT